MGGICFFLNGDRGLCVLAAVARAGIEIDAVIVPSSKRDILAKDLANRDVISTPCVNDPDFVTALRKRTPSKGVIAGFSTIFKAPLIEIFPEGVLNLHAGRVPYYRGGSPLNWQIINGEKEAGLSILRLTPGIDDGPLVKSGRIPIDIDDDIATVHKKANALFGTLLVEAMTEKCPDTPQDHKSARYWLQRSDADSHIDWHRSNAADVHNLVRAITRPYPGAVAGSRRIWKTTLDCANISGPPGRAAYISGKGPYVCCADRAILIKEYSGEKIRHGDYCTP